MYDNFDIKDSSDPLFNVIAGTSSGAMNAAILISHVVHNNNKWKGSVEKLNSFWDYVSVGFDIESLIPGFKEWWKAWHNLHYNTATEEAARRYFSVLQFLFSGIQNVYSSPPYIRFDDKFFNPFNSWLFYSNQPLKNSLASFVKFPIATDSTYNQPRLLLLTVDVLDGSSVTFDSYVKEDGIRKSEYGEYYRIGSDGRVDGHLKVNTDVRGYYKYSIKYNDGIILNHAIASGSVPIGYDYTNLNVEERLPPNSINDRANNSQMTGNVSSNTLHQSSNSHNKIVNYKKTGRSFWDGGLLSNTPLRELLEAHRNYWLKVKKVGEDSVPDLEVYIANVWQAREESIPLDLDRAKARLYDILLCDKTEYDRKVADIVSDYIQLFEKTREFALNHVKIKTKKMNLRLSLRSS